MEQSKFEDYFLHVKTSAFPMPPNGILSAAQAVNIQNLLLEELQGHCDRLNDFYVKTILPNTEPLPIISLVGGGSILKRRD